jgi:hypothetical protein
VQSAGQKLLAGAGLAQDQDGGVRPGNLLELMQDSLDDRTLADYLSVVVLEPDLLLQVDVVCLQPVFETLDFLVSGSRGFFRTLALGNVECHAVQKKRRAAVIEH